MIKYCVLCSLKRLKVGSDDDEEFRMFWPDSTNHHRLPGRPGPHCDVHCRTLPIHAKRGKNYNDFFTSFEVLLDTSTKL